MARMALDMVWSAALCLHVPIYTFLLFQVHDVMAAVLQMKV